MKKNTIMLHRLPITKARINLGQVARLAHVGKEYFILEKGGIPVAGILDAEELEDYLELRDPTIKRQIQASHREYRAGKSRPAQEFLAELRRERQPKAARRKRA